jgi:hypothetical protein
VTRWIQRLGWLFCGMWFLAVASCATPPPAATAPEAARPRPSSVAELAAAIEIDAQRSDHEADSKTRRDLAAEASADADACVALEPQAAACLYGRAVALGLNARAHPTRANEYLSSMLDALARAETADPNYDEAGPARVRALVLIRAPGWPLGPGDAESGLAAAHRAVTLQPNYPPNQLALAEAMAKTGDNGGALQTYAHARDAALAFPESPDRDEWLHDADQGLQRK